MAKRVGSYEIEGELGRGGMGIVYVARQPALERRVILKRLRDELSEDDTQLERFAREARVAAQVLHENVVAVHDCFSWYGKLYIVQEFVDGSDLRSLLARAGRLPPRIAALIAVGVLRGLEEIHARGIVHRDVKPANVLIGKTGETKLGDFGIALEGLDPKLTRPGTMLGSPPYMPPEQLLGERVDHRGDLYAFGVLLYEMLTGAVPFGGAGEEGEETLLERIQRGRYRPVRRISPAVPRYLDRTVRRCLQARRDRRPRNATLLRRRLERRLGRPSPVDARREVAEWFWSQGLFRTGGDETVPRREPPRPAARRVRRWLATAAVIALLLAAGPVGDGLGGGGGERGPAAAVPAAGPPAALRIAADPWAEVRVDDGPPFFTPRAAPLRLPPGVHTIRFRHPRFGESERTVRLAPGEERSVVQRWEPEGPRS